MTAIIPNSTSDNAQVNTISNADTPSPNTDQQQKEQETRLVGFWKNRIMSTRKLRVYDEFKKNRDEAKAFYRGDQITDTERSAWEGDTVQANLFRRMVNFMTDAVYSQNPMLRVTSRAKLQDDLNSPHYNTAIETHLQYIWDEESLADEVRRTFKDSFFSNLAAAKVDFDKERGLWRGKWVAGDLISDPNAHGDLSRARWLAELVQLPRYRVWQDETFDPIARAAIKEKSSQSEDQTFSEYPGQKETTRDLENIWYIYTKEGIEPLNPESIFNIGKLGTGKGKNRLIVISENHDSFLLNIEDPCPYLDDDQFPYSILRLDELPGEFIGPALWRQVESICRAFNWACSYHMTDMRKTASRPIGYDEDRVSDPDMLRSRKHMVPIPVKGDPKTAVSPLDTGQADKTIFQSVEFFRDLLDKMTGIDDIARGEEGKIKTATESQILQQNSSITLKGPQRALDNFMNDMIHKIALASLYYTPQFSIFLGPNQVLMTKAVQMQPIMNPMMPGMPQVDPMTGQPAMQPQVVPQPAQLTPEQAILYGATQQPDSMGMGVVSVYNGIVTDPNQVIMKGIDYFHGDQVAMMWPKLDFDSIKNDIDFSIEAGSSRAESRNQRQRAAMQVFETFGPIYQQMGLWDNYWELMNVIITAFDLFSLDKIIPDKQKFVQSAMMMQQMMAQQQMQSTQGGMQNPPKQSHKMDESNNGGKAFPQNEGNKNIQ